MGLISGAGYLLFWLGSLPRSVRVGGMSGWIPILKRQNGQEKKRKNSFIWPKYSLLNGELQLQQWEEHLPSAQIIMKNCQIKLRAKLRLMTMTQESFVQVRLTQILKLSPVGQIQLIWMMMKRKCFKNVGLELQTLREKRLKERQGRSNQKKQGDLQLCKSKENSKLQVLMFLNH